MCDQTEIEYKAGQVVWCKLSNLWWPAQVQDQANLEEEVTQGLKKKPFAVVKFFNEDYYDFVKDIKQICHYNSSRKFEFIKKGMDIYRSRGDTNQMNKFPKDIIIAEELTDGNINILDDPRLAPEEKVSYKEFFTTPKTQKENNKNSKKSKNPFIKSKFHNTFSQSLGKSGSEKNYFNKYLIQKSCEPSTNQYKCTDCNFVCSRLMLLCHHRSYNKQNGCPRVPTKFSKANSSLIKLEKSSVKRKSIGNELTPLKKKLKIPLKGPSDDTPKKIAKIKTSISKEVKEKDKKKSEAMREQLLLDWNEEETEEISDVTQDVPDVLEYKQEEKPVVENINKTSCFDFEDNEEDMNMDRSIRFGQKLPRVIPKEDKTKDKSKEKSINQESVLEEEFNNIMKETSVPVIPIVTDSFLSDSSALPGSSGKAETNLGSKANKNKRRSKAEDGGTLGAVSCEKKETLPSEVMSSSKKADDDNSLLLHVLESDSPAEMDNREDSNKSCKRANSSLCEEVVKKFKSDADLLASLRSDSDSNSDLIDNHKLIHVKKGFSVENSPKKSSGNTAIERADDKRGNEKSPLKEESSKENKSVVNSQKCVSRRRSSLTKVSEKVNLQISDVENRSEPNEQRLDKLSNIKKTNDNFSRDGIFKGEGKSPIKSAKDKSLKSPYKKSSTPRKDSHSKSPTDLSSAKGLSSKSVSSLSKKIKIKGSKIKKSSEKFKPLRSSKKVIEVREINSDETSNSFPEESVEKRIAMLLSDSSCSDSLNSNEFCKRQKISKSSERKPSKVDASKVEKKLKRRSSSKHSTSKTVASIEKTKSINKLGETNIPVLTDNKKDTKVLPEETQSKLKHLSSEKAVPHAVDSSSSVLMEHREKDLRKDRYLKKEKLESKPTRKGEKAEAKKKEGKLCLSPTDGTVKKVRSEIKESSSLKVKTDMKIDSKSHKSPAKTVTVSKTFDVGGETSPKGSNLKTLKSPSNAGSILLAKGQSKDKSDVKVAKNEQKNAKESTQPSVSVSIDKKEISPRSKSNDSATKKRRCYVDDDAYNDLFKPDIITTKKPTSKVSSDVLAVASSPTPKRKDDLNSPPKLSSPPQTHIHSSKGDKLSKEKSSFKSIQKQEQPASDPLKIMPIESKPEHIESPSKQVEVCMKSPRNNETIGSDLTQISNDEQLTKDSSESFSKLSSSSSSKITETITKIDGKHDLKSEKLKESSKTKPNLKTSEKKEDIFEVRSLGKRFDSEKTQDLKNEISKEVFKQLADSKETDSCTIVETVTEEPSDPAINTLGNQESQESSDIAVNDPFSVKVKSDDVSKSDSSYLKIEESSNSEFKLLEVLSGDAASIERSFTDEKDPFVTVTSATPTNQEVQCSDEGNVVIKNEEIVIPVTLMTEKERGDKFKQCGGIVDENRDVVKQNCNIKEEFHKCLPNEVLSKGNTLKPESSVGNLDKDLLKKPSHPTEELATEDIVVTSTLELEEKNMFANQNHMDSNEKLFTKMNAMNDAEHVSKSEENCKNNSALSTVDLMEKVDNLDSATQFIIPITNVAVSGSDIMKVNDQNAFHKSDKVIESSSVLSSGVLSAGVSAIVQNPPSERVSFVKKDENETISINKNVTKESPLEIDAPQQSKESTKGVCSKVLPNSMEENVELTVTSITKETEPSDSSSDKIIKITTSVTSTQLEKTEILTNKEIEVFTCDDTPSVETSLVINRNAAINETLSSVSESCSDITPIPLLKDVVEKVKTVVHNLDTSLEERTQIPEHQFVGNKDHSVDEHGIVKSSDVEDTSKVINVDVKANENSVWNAAVREGEISQTLQNETLALSSTNSTSVICFDSDVAPEKSEGNLNSVSHNFSGEADIAESGCTKFENRDCDQFQAVKCENVSMKVEKQPATEAARNIPDQIVKHTSVKELSSISTPGGGQFPVPENNTQDANFENLSSQIETNVDCASIKESAVIRGNASEKSKLLPVSPEPDSSMDLDEKNFKMAAKKQNELVDVEQRIESGDNIFSDQPPKSENDSELLEFTFNNKLDVVSEVVITTESDDKSSYKVEEASKSISVDVQNIKDKSDVSKVSSEMLITKRKGVEENKGDTQTKSVQDPLPILEAALSKKVNNKRKDSVDEEGSLYNFDDQMSISSNISSDLVVTVESEDKTRDSIEEENSIYNFDDQLITAPTASLPQAPAKNKPKTNPFGDLKINLSKSANIIDLPKDFPSKVMSADFLTPDKIKEIFKQGGTSSGTLLQTSSLIRPIVVPPQSLLEEKLNPQAVVARSASGSLPQGFASQDVQSMELDINSMPIVIADIPEVGSSVSTSTSTTKSSVVVSSSTCYAISQSVTPAQSVQQTNSNIPEERSGIPIDHYVKIVKPGMYKPKPGTSCLVFDIPAAKPLTLPHFHHQPFQSTSKIVKLVPQMKPSMSKLSPEPFGNKELVIVTSAGKKRVIFKSDNSFLSSLGNKKTDNPSSKLVVTVQNSEPSTSGKSKLSSVASVRSRTVQLVSPNILKATAKKTLSIPSQLKILPQQQVVTLTASSDKKFVSIRKMPATSEQPKRVRFKEPEVIKSTRAPNILASHKSSVLKSVVTKPATLKVDQLKDLAPANKNISSGLLTISEADVNEASRLIVTTKASLDSLESSTSGLRKSPNNIRVEPKEDILAKALADTQVFQENDESDESAATFAEQPLYDSVPSNISCVTIGGTVETTTDIPSNVLPYSIGSSQFTSTNVIQPSMPLLSDETSPGHRSTVQSNAPIYQFDCSQFIVSTTVTPKSEETSGDISPTPVFSNSLVSDASGESGVLAGSTTQLTADVNLSEIELPPGRPPDDTPCSIPLPNTYHDISSIPLPPEPYTGTSSPSPSKQTGFHSTSENVSSNSDKHSLTSLFQSVSNS